MKNIPLSDFAAANATNEKDQVKVLEQHINALGDAAFKSQSFLVHQCISDILHYAKSLKKTVEKNVDKNKKIDSKLLQERNSWLNELILALNASDLEKDCYSLFSKKVYEIAEEKEKGKQSKLIDICFGYVNKLTEKQDNDALKTIRGSQFKKTSDSPLVSELKKTLKAYVDKHISKLSDDNVLLKSRLNLIGKIVEAIKQAEELRDDARLALTIKKITKKPIKEDELEYGRYHQSSALTELISDLDEKLNNLSIEPKFTDIVKLKSDLEDEKNQNATLTSQTKNDAIRISALNHQTTVDQIEIKNLQNQVEGYTKENADLRNQIEVLQQQKQKLQTTESKELKKLKDDNEAKKQEVAKLKVELNSKNSEITKLKTLTDDQAKKLTEQSKKIEQLEHKLSQKDQEVLELNRGQILLEQKHEEQKNQFESFQKNVFDQFKAMKEDFNNKLEESCKKAHLLGKEEALKELISATQPLESPGETWKTQPAKMWKPS